MISNELREQYKDLFDKDEITCVATVFLMDDGRIGVVSMGPLGTNVRLLLSSGLKSMDKDPPEEDGADRRVVIAEEKRVLN